MPTTPVASSTGAAALAPAHAVSPVASAGAATISPALARRISDGCGENAHRCYQCKRCTVGCPAAEFADLHPAQIMRAVQLGDTERAVQSRFIWLCTGCQTCSTRCPQSIDVAAVMDELRKVACERSTVHENAPFAHVLKLTLASIRRWGRLYEAELFALDKLSRPKSFTQDLRLAAKLLLKRRVKLLPETGDRTQMKRMLTEIDRINTEKATARRARGDRS